MNYAKKNATPTVLLFFRITSTTRRSIVNTCDRVSFIVLLLAMNLTSPTRYIQTTQLPPRISRKEEGFDFQVYRIIIDRRDIQRATHVLRRLNRDMLEKKGPPLFTMLNRHADVLVVYTHRSNFRKIITPRIQHMYPCILKSPQRKGKGIRSRLTASHPCLGPQ